LQKAHFYVPPMSQGRFLANRQGRKVQRGVDSYSLKEKKHMPNDVQPEQGQGDSGTGIFDSYLQNVPEDGREVVQGYLKDAERDVNERLQEASQLKETWGGYDQYVGPYREQYSPEDLAQVLAWHQQTMQDDNSYQEWLKTAAAEAGLIQQAEQETDPLEEEGNLSKEQIQQLVNEQATAQLGPLQERLELWETEKLTEAETIQINSTLSSLEQEHKITLNKDQKAMVMDLGMNDESDNWLETGFDRFRTIYAEGGKLFVQNAQSLPGAHLTSGGTEAGAKAPPTFKEASQMARERLSAQNSA
jgi:hypothetical protein